MSASRRTVHATTSISTVTTSAAGQPSFIDASVNSPAITNPTHLEDLHSASESSVDLFLTTEKKIGTDSLLLNTQDFKPSLEVYTIIKPDPLTTVLLDQVLILLFFDELIYFVYRMFHHPRLQRSNTYQNLF